MRLSPYWPGLLAGFVSLSGSALAHPVAQGALDIQIRPAMIHVRARVSGEEIFVANAFSALDQPKAKSLSEVWERHGGYLLEHLRVSADDHPCPGRVLSVSADHNDFVLYELEFTRLATPSHLRFEEDVLNEIEFAPGNPWEASYVVRVSQAGLATQEGLLLSRKQPLTLELGGVKGATASLDKGHMLQQYVRHGIGHILGGYDHLLFVIALALAAATFWDLVKVVSAFTVAHTVTLTLSVLNLIRLSSSVVEPMIAASIVFVALTNVFWPRRSRGWLRLATAFFFGLFHGLGFAGGLLAATDGMAQLAVFIALAGFSLGVELGHQMVVLPLFFGLKLARNTRAGDLGRERFMRAAIQCGSVLISLVGMFYLIAALR